MAVYAYLRVPTDAQGVENQKNGILEYANTHELGQFIYIEDKPAASSTGLSANWANQSLCEQG